MRHALALLGPLVALACTGRPVPGPGDDELGDVDESESSQDSSDTGEVDTSSDDTSSADTSSDVTSSDDSSSEATDSEAESSEDTTTGEPIRCKEVIGTDLVIDADTPLESLACLRKVSGRLRIDSVDWTDLSALPMLEEVEELWLYQVPSLVDLSGTSLVSIGTLRVSGSSLTSTAGLENLEALENLYLSINPEVSVELPVGLPTRSIDFNGSASDLGQLASLQPQPSGSNFYVSVSSDTVVDLDGLLDCCGFPELDFTLWQDAAVPDFTGLQGLTAMQGLHVFQVGAPISFTGLEQLETIGSLEVRGDKCHQYDDWEGVELTSLAGLDGLTAIDQLTLAFLFEFQTLAGLPPGVSVNMLTLRNLKPLTTAEAEAFAQAVQAASSWLCGMGDEDLCLTEFELGICPQ